MNGTRSPPHGRESGRVRAGMGEVVEVRVVPPRNPGPKRIRDDVAAVLVDARQVQEVAGRADAPVHDHPAALLQLRADVRRVAAAAELRACMPLFRAAFASSDAFPGRPTPADVPVCAARSHMVFMFAGRNPKSASAIVRLAGPHVQPFGCCT